MTHRCVATFISWALCFGIMSHAREMRIESIDSFAQVADMVQWCDQNTFVVFDIDETLIIPRDALGNFPPSFHVTALSRYPELFDQQRWEWAHSLVLKQSEQFVFDDAAIPLIQQLKERGCTLIGLTNTLTGSFGIIDNVEQWRAQVLRDKDIDFGTDFPDVTFDELAPCRGNYPVLHRGILYTNMIHRKGAILGAFLDRYKLTPTKVVFFDDLVRNIVSVGQECQRRGIAFVGYLFQGGHKLRRQWDTEIALAQLDAVMQEGRWIPDSAFS